MFYWTPIILILTTDYIICGKDLVLCEKICNFALVDIDYMNKCKAATEHISPLT